jgi:RNA polymerase sigma-70 factor (ECF subfamily)
MSAHPYYNTAPLSESSWDDCGDDELLSGVAGGNKAAFQVLYLRHYCRIQKFVLRVTQRGDLIEEVLNDTFFTVWQKAAAFNANSKVSTWIFGICYKKCLKALERSERWRARHCDALETEPALVEKQFWPDEEAFQVQLQYQLARQLRELPVEQRMVFELTYFLGYSYSEIAQIADVSINTIKTRMFHARRKLRRSLQTHAGMAN